MTPAEVRSILGPLQHESIYRECRRRVADELAALQAEAAALTLRRQAISERIAMLRQIASGLAEVLEISRPTFLVNTTQETEKESV